MKQLLQSIIQKRNPNFSFDPALDNFTLVSFFWAQIWGILRGCKLVFRFQNPKMASLGKNVHFFNSRKISFGKFMKIGNNVHLSALGKNGITIGNNVSIGAFSRIIISTSFNHLGEHIKIGNNVGLGEFTYLGGAGGLEIGDECIVGQYFSCHPENHIVADPDISIRHQGVTRKGIKIGKNCWIGSKVTILDGVEIGDGCVIAAGAVVNKSFPKNSIIGGVPAKILKTR
ncbi:acyltransferase [Brumimicrobium aurantiacum]|uniref:Acyltransferase n=1 Tax=Brumimicrobium aurantiacum TaxID=1737063 RepID=A0A3E1EZP0_9FLAO|nr:acyltransferase [Brumimicrobium aurantiacum]RFC55039.1 acyltransferase [Brumimicrobium aurantiacum]